MKKYIIILLIIFPISLSALWRQHLQAIVAVDSIVYDANNMKIALGSIPKGDKIIIKNIVVSNDNKNTLFRFYNSSLKKYCLIDSKNVKVSSQFAASLAASEKIGVKIKDSILSFVYKNKRLLNLKLDSEVSKLDLYLYDQMLCAFIFDENEVVDLYIIDINKKKIIFKINNSQLEFPTHMGFSKNKKYFAIDQGTYENLRNLEFYSINNPVPVYSTSVSPIYTMDWSKNGFYYEKYIGKELDGYPIIPNNEEKAYFAKCIWDNEKERIIEYFVDVSYQ